MNGAKIYMSKMKDKFGVGWFPKDNKAVGHFFVGELPICGAKVISNKDYKPKHYCKRCLLSLDKAVKSAV